MNAGSVRVLVREREREIIFRNYVAFALGARDSVAGAPHGKVKWTGRSFAISLSRWDIILQNLFDKKAKSQNEIL